MLPELVYDTGSHELIAKIKLCSLFFWTANSKTKDVPIELLNLSGYHSSTFSLLSSTLSIFFLFFSREFFYPLQPFAADTRFCTSQLRETVFFYCSLSLLLHSAIPPPSHKNFITMRKPPSAVRPFFSGSLICVDVLQKKEALYRKPMIFTAIVDCLWARSGQPGQRYIHLSHTWFSRL